MRKKIKEFRPVIFDSYEEACKYEIETFSAFPIIENGIVKGYRIWSEEDKNYLRDIISEELYWKGYNSKDYNTIKKEYDYPTKIIWDICYGISLIEQRIEDSFLEN